MKRIETLNKEFKRTTDRLEAIGRTASAACRKLVDVMKRIQPKGKL